ncbi:acetyl-CoA carboxylase biotin carboxyl carrier protein [Paenibacillus alkalitolerans]|uniref:acetyl-CoA carboxylase biotin carboxyl carrier protein n=1 Tax=Paenibacillus alkalitolerans TaxID=2799335 RepID=UPI0018F4AF0E|nr:acetyl-CoA carboxylase biotin carboxyl carrier protein [Paenibacillus alkalitolerans]
MYKLSEIKELIKLVDSTSIQELQIENENGKLTIRKPEPKAADAAAVAQHAVFAQPAYVPAPVSVPQQTAVHTSALPAAQQLPEAKAEQADNADLHRIVSPMVGTFYAASSPGADAYVKVGDTVNEKTVVCIVEAMKLMNEIEAEVKGQIVEILVENGQLVEYGQPLFLVKR